MIEEQRKAKTAVDIANNREESEKVNLINTIVKRKKRRRNIVLINL